jgi:GTPase SAR1 family protein
MSEIITKLPSTLQIECIQYLKTPNERIILAGFNGVGKTSFIRRCTNREFQTNYIPNNTNLPEIVTLNQRAKVVVLSDQWTTGIEQRLLRNAKQLPTRVILMASVITSISLRKIYQYYIPIFLELEREMLANGSMFTIDIVLTNTDHPRYTWRELELRKLKLKVREFNINPVFYVSNKTGDGFDNKYFDYLRNEF